MPFSFDLSFDALLSVRRFERALARQIGCPPEPVSPTIWKMVIRIALRDPRITRRRRSGEGRTPLTLERLIVEYAQRARPWTPSPAGEEPEDIAWPVLRDEAVLFRLAHLRAYLERVVKGEPASLREVTEAVRNLGGVSRGCVRFGKSFVRCWTLPRSCVRHSAAGVPGRASS